MITQNFICKLRYGKDYTFDPGQVMSFIFYTLSALMIKPTFVFNKLFGEESKQIVLDQTDLGAG